MRTVRSANGTGLAVTVTGQGPVMVLVDGAMASQDSHPSAPGLDDALSDVSTVVRYDRRGRGSSDDGPTGIDVELEDLAAVIRELGDEATLCGFSSGAVLALEAARAGLPINGLVLYEPPCVVTDDRAPVPPDYPERVRNLVDDGDLAAAFALFMTQPVGMPAEVVEQMATDPGFRSGAKSARSLPFDAQVMAAVSTGDVDTLRRFSEIQNAALVMSGGATEPWLTAAALAVTKVLPNAQHQVIEGQGHDPSAESLAPVLHAFLPR